MDSTPMISRTFENFEWTDFCDPNKEDLKEIAEKYQLDFHQIKDSLEPGHLPKYEKEANYQFLQAQCVPDFDSSGIGFIIF